MSTTSGELSELSDAIGRRPVRARLRALASASWLLAQTPFAASELRDVIPDATVGVLPNPVVAIDPVPPLLGTPSVAFTGRLSVEKDLVRLLEAWREVLLVVPGATLVIAGSGGGYRSVEAEVSAAVADCPVLAASVSLPGWVDTAAVLGGADVWVLPSWSEGMSNALLEACAAGRVVVASDIEANVAVLGDDYPLYHRVRDTASLRDVLLSALNDDIVRSRARSLALAAAHRQDVDVVVDRLWELLRDARRPRRKHA
jgi:glycosyltransferase involved in cell wall biosynthesis